MKLNYSLQFEQDMQAVLALFCNPDFYQKHQTLVGGKDFQVLESREDGDEYYVRFSYQVASDVPAFAKKVLGETSSVVHEETWNKSTGKGQISIDVATLPGTLECDAQLENVDGGCQKHFNWEIKVKIPLIGGKIEKVVADDIQRKKQPDEDAVNQLLKEF